MVTLILFVIIFGVVVVSHEFGHFLLAKANGIHVVEFAVGMGPTIFSFQKKETKYSLKLFPIGGACMFEGEDGLETKEGEPSEGSFLNASVWGRISTVFAGPFFNFILAFIIALIMVNLIVIRDPVATEVLEEHHYVVENIDATVIAQRPKLRPFMPQMEANICEALGIERNQLNLKATTEEGLGFTGREEGMAAQAICMLIPLLDLAGDDRNFGCGGCGGCGNC